MKSESHRVRGLDEICYYVKQHKEETEPWQIDFYTLDDSLLFRLENDEETLEAMKDDETLYVYIADLVDCALMMGVDFSI